MTAQRPFTRADLARAKTKLLHDGRVANAVVSRVEIGGRSWTVKDFSSRPWWVRAFILSSRTYSMHTGYSTPVAL